MKIFIISHDLSHNSVGRAVLLAQVFGVHHQVEVVGTAFGPDIWYPVRDIGIKYRKIEGELFLPQYTHLMGRLIDKLKGDVVIAVKPRPTSYGVALMHRTLKDRPVVLDIDDDEMAFYDGDAWKEWDRKTLLRRPNSPMYIKMMESMIPQANVRVVASRELQRRHGGHYLTHVKDHKFLDPKLYNKEEERQKHDIPPSDKIVVFAGSPRAHKGLEVLLEAVKKLKRDDVKLMVAGFSNDPNDKYESELRELGGEHIYGLKQIPYKELPALLCMADVVALPQLDTPEAQAQMPSKLFDAMAMALPVVASAISDIPEALGDGCGVTVPPGDVSALRDAIANLLESPERARQMGDNARNRLIERYSIDAAQPIVEAVLKEAMGG